MEKIVVIDCGGQYTHLICRRIRDLGLYSEIKPFNITIEEIKKLNPKGIIISGGPGSVHKKDSPKIEKAIFEWLNKNSIPILGICYGHQLIAEFYGAEVKAHKFREYGKAQLSILNKDKIFQGIAKNQIVWMSHGDQITKAPEGFKILAKTSTCPVASFANLKKNIYGLQFHPEVRHTKDGDIILKNFVFEICKSQKNWDLGNIVQDKIEEIRKKVGDKRVILGLSGGVDSSVSATLLHRAIGENVHLIFIDHGLLRKNEASEVVKKFRDDLKFKNFHFIDVSDIFLEKLKNIEDPEKKRKIIGHLFIKTFEKKARKLEKKYPNIKYLAQGTIYPDRVESAAVGKGTAKIKSHHNLTLPDKMDLEIIEPLDDFYKDEVRKIGKLLGLDEKIVQRHPFPGPGLAVRILGAVDRKKIQILQEADHILIDEIKKAGIYNHLWQTFAALIPVKTVGVMGDSRTYEYIISIRSVDSVDAMTANFSKIDWDILEKISSKIINSVSGVNRVVYDISNKPPATIEYE